MDEYQDLEREEQHLDSSKRQDEDHDDLLDYEQDND